MTVYEKLAKIQGSLKAPKSQYSDFGNFNYRSCEDILEAVKPLLQELSGLDYRRAMAGSDDLPFR